MQPLEQLLDPRCEPLPAQTALPIDHGQEPDESSKTAVIVCHGMGQQVRFQTLNDVVQLLRDEAFRRNEVITTVTTRLILFRGQGGECTDQLGRAEITLHAPGRDDRVVHLYEAYWAPLAEGRVTIRDVLWFLLQAGFHGIVAGLRGFRRLMFGGWVRLEKTYVTTLMFLFSLAVVLSLVIINSAIGLIIAGNVLKGGALSTWPSPALVNTLVSDLLIVEAVAIPIAVIIGLVHWHRNLFLRRNRMSAKRWRLPKGAERLLAAWVWLALSGTIVAAAHILVHGVGIGVSGDREFPRWVFVAVAGVAFLISYILRIFLIQYLGDVVVYLSGHAVSRFNEIRDEIQSIGIRVGRAVYGLPQYDRCVLLGHSLGSVVAYDLYNRLVNEHGASWKVEQRTPLLLTFGSPLDKTAFVFRLQQAKEADVREALAAAIQPIIADAGHRPNAWVNIWSPRDWISGELNFYERPEDCYVLNVQDADATIPLLAHTQYWQNRELARRLYDALRS